VAAHPPTHTGIFEAMPFQISRIPRRASPATLLLLTAACAGGRPAAPVGPAPAEPEPDVVWEAPAPVEPEVREPARDILGSVRYDLPVEANSWVEAELDFLVGQRSDVIRKWLERGDFYEPYIKDVLRSHGIPTDLYHLAAIESGFVPTARSHAGAVGMWQFMPTTGRGMGLRVDQEVDERMDPVRSTRAAARHLRALHASLGDWALAAAAYNAGTGRVTRGMASFGVSNFWDLAQFGDLAEETRRYVPRLYAVTVIGRDRARFGLDAPPPTTRFAYDSVQVEYATPLRELTRLGGASEDELRRLNPHLLGGATPSGGYWVWVPRGQGPDMQRAWLASDFRRDRGLGTYTVRWGDNLSMLAEQSGVRASRIRELNPSIDFDRLQTGARLALPYAAAQALSSRPSREEPRVAAASPTPAPETGPAPAAGAATNGSAPAGSTGTARPVAGTRVSATGAGHARSHRVAAGETLWGISRAYGVSVEAIQEANSLSDATIVTGQMLRLPVDGVVVADEMVEPAVPASEGVTERVEHVVQQGESLWGIARRYGATVEAIQAANELGDRPIQPGQKLIVPRSGGDRVGAR
jgi:membrane-bound lytic murein transglycosylase D